MQQIYCKLKKCSLTSDKYSGIILAYQATRREVIDLIDTDRLRGIIAERNLSQRKVAKLLGMSEVTFYRKMRTGVFDSNEIDALITLLKIKNPMSVFFANHVACDATFGARMRE